MTVLSLILYHLFSQQIFTELPQICCPRTFFWWLTFGDLVDICILGKRIFIEFMYVVTYNYADDYVCMLLLLTCTLVYWLSGIPGLSINN